jgi:hypothetical protein
VESTGTAPAEVKANERDYINAFANAVTLFGSPNVAGDAFAHMPALLVADFDSVRSELWLWDDSSGSAYLTNAAGLEGSHRRDYSVQDSVIGKVIASHKPVYNALLDKQNQDDRDFGASTGLTHVSAFPMMAKDKFVGVCANYTRKPVGKELLQWWELCGHIGAATLHQLLTDKPANLVRMDCSLLSGLVAEALTSHVSDGLSRVFLPTAAPRLSRPPSSSRAAPRAAAPSSTAITPSTAA